jgi:Zn-dependent metalloprotease
MTRFHLTLAAAIALALAGNATAAVAGPGERALARIGTDPSLVRASSADRFHARDVIVDADGTEHVRFDRTYGGLPVIGGDFVVHTRGAQSSASLTQKAPLRLSLRPSVPAADAIVAAGSEFGSDFRGVPTAALVVYARAATPLLAWRVGMQGDDADGNERDMTYIVSARDGRLLDRWSNIETVIDRPPPPPTTPPCTGTAATGLGKSLYAGNVSIGTTNCVGSFDLKDQARGGAWTADLLSKTSGGATFKDADNTWGNNTVSDRASAGVDAHFGVATTWRYFKNVHGRNGIGNDGKGAQARVHYGLNYANASWSDTCFCMNFGDGNATYGPLVSLDIAGHEMSHGITSRTAKLTNSGESGALNEGTSDIFGSMVEFYAANAVDAPDYLIGEKIVKAGGGVALRYMFKPSRDGYSKDCWATGIGSLNTHYSSGVANHFFYLLAQGAVAPAGYAYTKAELVCNGNTALVGIGRAKAEKIWYRALTVYMTSATNYAGARVATLNAARDLYGLNLTEYKAVAAAWSAVSVN